MLSCHGAERIAKIKKSQVPNGAFPAPPFPLGSAAPGASLVSSR